MTSYQVVQEYRSSAVVIYFVTSWNKKISVFQSFSWFQSLILVEVKERPTKYKKKNSKSSESRSPIKAAVKL